MRLVDADALKAKSFGKRGGLIHTSDIDAMPTVDAVPVVHGIWWHYEGMLTCSECGTQFYDNITEHCGDHVPKFCPECGAKMDGKDGDGNDS